MPTHLDCAKMTKMPRGKFSNRRPVKHLFFIEETIAVSAVVTAVYHCYGSAVPSVQWRHGNYAIRKFLSSLGNFCFAFIGGASAIGINSIALGLLNKSSRMVKDHAKNIPTEPMGSPPLETPIRLYEKPYTPIVPQANAPCL